MTTTPDGRYEVLLKLSEGGMGAVFKAREVASGSVVVLKTLKPQLGGDATARKRFLREGELARGLSHPNLASLHEMVEVPSGAFYLVMELVEGVNLSDLLDSGGPLPAAEALDLAAQAAEGLGYLHDRGVVHRDVSPENLMVRSAPPGRTLLKIIDLGVAKAADAQGLTTTGLFVGKLRYGSPEQLGSLKKGQTIDGRSDVYSLGCVLYQLLTGVPPFEAETPQAYLRLHLFEEPRSFAESDPEGRVPEEVRRAVLTALAKKREERYGSAREMAAALRALRDRLLDEASRRRGRERSAIEAEATESLAARVEAARVTNEGRTRAVDETDLATAGLAGRLRDETWDHPPAPLVPDDERMPTVRLSGDRPSAEGSSARGPAVRPGRGRLLALVAAAAAVVALAAAGLLVTFRAPSPSPAPAPGPPAPPGALLVTASPWARVVSVLRESDGVEAATGEIATPVRLELPEGRYRVTLRGEGDGAELVVPVAVRAGVETPLHGELPGFDLEAAVRAYAP